MKRNTIIISILFCLSFFIAISPALAYNPTVEYSDDLVAYWKFDDRINPEFVGEVPYGLTQDETRNDNTGILKNGAEYTIEGKEGEAMEFDGINDYIEVIDDPTLNFSAFTINCWILTYDDGNVGGIIEKYSLGDGEGWEIFQLGGTIRAIIETDTGQTILDSTTGVSEDIWYFISLVYDGSDFELYINSVLEDIAVDVGRLLNVSENLLIGSIWSDNPVSSFDGLIDEVSIFNTALNQTDIQSIMENGIPIIEPEPDIIQTIVLPAILIGGIGLAVFSAIFISKKRSVLPKR